ncbi:MAG: GTP cyclohydrolase, FolE2/MptA family, partial [Planctomycetota bacterium]
MNPRTLPDVQSYSDSRNISINKVGVTEVPWGFAFAPTSVDLSNAQPTVGSVDLFVALASDKKGTHMSRFVQILAENERVLSYAKLVDLF